MEKDLYNFVNLSVLIQDFMKSFTCIAEEDKCQYNYIDNINNIFNL